MVLRTDFWSHWEARRKAVILVGVWRRPLAIWTDWTDFGEGTDARPTKRRSEPEVLAIFAKHLSRLPEFFLVR
ncbi:hypothetical protein RIE95_03025 [Acidithiobacillus thiooxidans]|uniref:hypothetical protein n=1 Tax=Acidithiobacillus thiooxidans TaxID=930 RepID=UPI00286040A7|nr:hypothetical protein [Acidithiobacillus thiooxidans]MDR7925973.1 hypothetical protein [Acidithiobacillus thiooxidans]MDX5934305.1 hypothetical protein [Acidithiobacillus thiooxidans]